ncbi:MAG: hypothetical protein U1F36_05690 [Planctomycetota bacterium]
MKIPALALTLLGSGCTAVHAPTPVLRGPVTAILRDDRMLLCASQSGVACIEGDRVEPFANPGFRVLALTTGDGALFGAGGIPGEHGIVVAWRDGREVARAEIAADLLTAIVFDATDHTLVCSGADGAVLLLDAGSLALRRVLRRHGGAVRALALSQGILASAGLDGALLLGPRDAEPRALRAHAAGIEALAWSTDGSELASACLDGRVRTFAREGRLLRASDPIRARLLALIASPQTGGFVSADAEGTLRHHDAQGMRTLFAGDGTPVFALAPVGDALCCGRRELVTWHRAAR